jgi:hypothetical protein
MDAPHGAHVVGAERRLAAIARLEPRSPERPQVVGMAVGVLADEMAITIGVGEASMPAKVGLERVNDREDHPTAGPQDASQLKDGGVEIGKVSQCEAADDEVELLVDGRDREQVALRERSRGDVLAGAGEHLGGEIDAEDLVTERDEAGGVAARATRGVERPPWRHRIEERPHRRLLDSDDGIAGFVVALRPRSVPIAGVGFADLRLGQETVVGEDAADLGEPPLTGIVRAVVEMAKQGQALDADQ